jgi:hypothetical protein
VKFVVGLRTLNTNYMKKVVLERYASTVFDKRRLIDAQRKVSIDALSVQ